MVDCHGKEVPEVSPDLEHPVFGAGFRQIVKVDLQGELVEIFQRTLAERIDKILLDEELLHLCCFFFPVCFAISHSSTSRAADAFICDLSPRTTETTSLFCRLVVGSNTVLRKYP